MCGLTKTTKFWQYTGTVRKDSTDTDAHYVVEKLPPFADCKRFCDSIKNENANLIVIEDGVVTDCYKGTPDEINNALLATYNLHYQTYPLFVERLVKRDVYIKVIRAVFDKDSFSPNKFNGAIIKAQNNGIGCAWSNEAFELLYLYHFMNRVTAMSRTEYKRAISEAVNISPQYKKKKVYEYAKNDKDNYRIMTTYGSMENAIKFAEEKSRDYTDQRYATHNPCTMVFKLVR